MFSAFADRSGRTVPPAHAGIALVLMLPASATGSERFEFAVLGGDGE